MKGSYFVRKSNIYVTPLLISVHMLFIAICLFFLYRFPQKFIIVVLIISIFSVLIFTLIKIFNTIGLYIIGNKLFYKNLSLKEVNPFDIVGVKVIKSRAVGKYIGNYDLKTIKGKQLYSAVFLNKLDGEMIKYNRGDLEFISKYRSNVIFTIRYDFKAVKKIQEINKQITVIAPEELIDWSKDGYTKN